MRLIKQFFSEPTFILLLTFATLTPKTAQGIPAEELYNYRVAAGVAVGTATQSGSSAVKFFGIPVLAGIWIHPSVNYSAGLELRVTPDLANVQVAQTGIEGAFSYHLLGGSPSVVEGGGTIGINRIYDYSVSALLKTGLISYSLSNPVQLNQELSGDILSVKMGGTFRYTSYDLELLFTAISIPAGTVRIQESSFEAILGYRWQM